MKHWRIEDVAWDRFEPGRVDADVLRLVKAASVVERNGVDYAAYLNNVFTDDPDFQRAADNWAVEEVQHGDALGQWAMLADPAWNYPAAFERYRNSYHIPIEVDASVRGSRTGELIARCMVETGTSSFYTALADATDEPVLKTISKQIAADEYRHFKLFYDHMHRYLKREKLGVVARTRIALGRVTESEDDELAYAYHCTNEPDGTAYDHAALHRRLHVAGDGVLPVPPHRAGDGDDVQDHRLHAARPGVARRLAARLCGDAPARAEVRACGAGPAGGGG